MADIHDVYRIFQKHFRPKRMRAFAELFGVDDRKRIIDVGGDKDNWEFIEAKPEVTIVNLDIDEERIGRFRLLPGDARALDLPDNAFDIAYSNSVIEHVGTLDDQRRFAEETRRLAPRYYVQTPNRWFFIEPHFIAAFIHFLPKSVFRKMLPFFSLWYWIHWPTREEIDSVVDEINLLTADQMRELFPDAEIIHERVLGMTKSIIAVRR